MGLAKNLSLGKPFKTDSKQITHIHILLVFHNDMFEKKIYVQ